MGNEGSIIAIPMFANVIEPGGEKRGEWLVHSKGKVVLYITDTISEITHLANDCLYRWRLWDFKAPQLLKSNSPVCGSSVGPEVA